MALPPWTRPDNFRLPPHQAIIESVNSLLPITPVGNGEVFGSPHGTGVSGGRPKVPPGTVLVGIDSALTPGGLYAGTILKFDPPSGGVLDPASATTDLSALLAPSTSNTIACYFINLPEYGLTTHDLTDGDNEAGLLTLGIYTGIPTTDGKPVVAGIAIPYGSC